MKVLVATCQTQGGRDDDYCWTVEGELVLGAPILECDSADTCGCGRGFPGLASSRATTTAMIVERPELNRASLATAIYDSLQRQGYLDVVPDEDIDQGLADEIELIEDITAAFEVGTVVGRSGTTVHARSRAARR